MNDLYIENKDGTYTKTAYRGPIHNTKARPAGATDRLIRLLSEVDKNVGERGVNIWIKDNRPQGYHGDHAWPLSLGGQHSIHNLVAIPAAQNLEKGAELTFEVFQKATKDLDTLKAMVGSHFIDIISKNKMIIGDCPLLFAQHRVLMEQELKREVKRMQKTFRNATDEEKVRILLKLRPDLSPGQQQRFIGRFSRK